MVFDTIERPLTYGPDGSAFLHAPAKINLFLHLTGRRDDGYHLIESLFVFTQHGDLLRFHEADQLIFDTVGPFSADLSAANMDDNLVVRAAKAISAYANVECHARIVLEKNLPVASGIGGGSADAAAALVGLNQFWELGLREHDLHLIGQELGADVPACISSKPSFVTGIGECLSSVTLPENAGIVIVNPLKPVSTAEIFNKFSDFRSLNGLPPFERPISNMNKVIEDWDALNHLTTNSLQGVAELLCPDIDEMVSFLNHNSQAKIVRMSGSGASVFSLYHDKLAAQAAARHVQERAPDWWVMADEIAG
jgi:4-diphosphocytidyl-2-C-methyl-D-erythritol kinase